MPIKRFSTGCYPTRTEIERAFGTELSWQRLDDKRSCRIAFTTTIGGWKSDEQKFPEIQDAMIDAMIRLEKALKPQLAALEIGTEPALDPRERPRGMEVGLRGIPKQALKEAGAPEIPFGHHGLLRSRRQDHDQDRRRVFPAENSEAIIERWVATDVTTSPKIQREIQEFFKQHGVTSVAMSDGNMGCPHEEGEDFPEGEDCPFCPFWKGKQGSNQWF